MKSQKLLLLILIIFVTSGCTISLGKKKTTNDLGGIYLSYEKGNNWQTLAYLMTADGTRPSFQGVNVNFLKMDPTDNLALYAGTTDSLYYSYNGGQGWFKTLEGLGNIKDLDIDPKNHCNIYAAVDNRLYQTTDCGRFWDYKLIEQGNPQIINTLAIDSYSPENIYVGTANNGLFKSEDGGYSWRNLKYYDSPVVKILVSDQDTRIIYVITLNSGTFRSLDAGATWEEITKNIQSAMEDDKIDKNCGNVKAYKNLIFDPKNNSRLLYATNCLMETTDQGNSWTQIKLLTKPGDTNIYGLAISYENNQEIYYGTKTTLYRTEDNGQNWITKDLPTLRTAGNLLTDPINPTLLYLGQNNLK